MFMNRPFARSRQVTCPITYEVMQDPVVASDGHTYERAAIEEVLALPEDRRKSPLTRAVLQPFLFPNIALKNRIAAHEQDEHNTKANPAMMGVRDGVAPGTTPAIDTLVVLGVLRRALQRGLSDGGRVRGPLEVLQR